MEGFQLFRATQLVFERERDLVTDRCATRRPSQNAALAGQRLAQPLQSPEGWLTLRICRKANGQPWKTLRRDGTACCVYKGNKAIARGT